MKSYLQDFRPLYLEEEELVFEALSANDIL